MTAASWASSSASEFLLALLSWLAAWSGLDPVLLLEFGRNFVLVPTSPGLRLAMLLSVLVVAATMLLRDRGFRLPLALSFAGAALTIPVQRLLAPLLPADCSATGLSAAWALCFFAVIALLIHKKPAAASSEAPPPSLLLPLLCGASTVAAVIPGLPAAGLALAAAALGRHSPAAAWKLAAAAALPGLSLHALQAAGEWRGNVFASPSPVILSVVMMGLVFAGLLIWPRLLRGLEDCGLRWTAWAALVLALAMMWAMNRHMPHQQRVMEVMGTGAEVQFWCNPVEADRLAKIAFDEFAATDLELSLYKPESELSRLNREAAERDFPCGERLWRNLVAAEQAWKLSGGAFDVTIGPLMRLWGFYGKRNSEPDEAEINEVLKRTGFHHVRLDHARKTCRFLRPGVEIDLGGIAKGLAVDRAVELLQQAGCRRGLVDLAGNLRVFGPPPPHAPAYAIGVKDPRDKSAVLASAQLLEQSTSTSGSYERFVIYQGRKWPHIIDPRTGRPRLGADSVSIVCPSAMWADILSTTLFVAGPEAAAPFEAVAGPISFLWVELPSGAPVKAIRGGGAFQQPVK
ncbi:MAG: hypothetical protein RL095_2949 [Verrucomicrobiota bacterium]|jgi:thiamine biosynthesis lipoprotein